MTNMSKLPVPPEPLVPSLRLLLEAYNCAKHVGCAPERYAVEAPAFWSIGTPQAVLRWLCDVGQVRHLDVGHVRHLVETTPSGGSLGGNVHSAGRSVGEFQVSLPGKKRAA